jgi:hypothetical protein
MCVPDVGVANPDGSIGLVVAPRSLAEPDGENAMRIGAKAQWGRA